MTDAERMKAEDRITRAANALYDFEWADAIRQGMMPVDFGATMNALRLKAEAVLKAVDGYPHQAGSCGQSEAVPSLSTLSTDLTGGLTGSRAAQAGPSACPNCGWEDGWGGTPPCQMPWGGRHEDWDATYRNCKFRRK